MGDEQGLARAVPAPGSRKPSQQAVSAASGFDPSRMMQDFYLSRYYEPMAERPADNVQAAIEFALDRVAERLEARAEHILAVGKVDQGEQFGQFVQGWKQGAYNHLYLAASEIGQNLPRDSDRSGEASETRSGSTEGESAGLQGIAQTEPPHVG